MDLDFENSRPANTLTVEDRSLNAYHGALISTNVGQIKNDTDGTSQSAYAAGTVYSLTATPALIDFGTTDPSITITSPGRYLIHAGAALKYTGATYAGAQTATVTVRRTNNTAADITSATRTIQLEIVTTITGNAGMASVPPVVYQATAGDILQVFGSVSATPSAGSVDVTSAEILIVKLQ